MRDIFYLIKRLVSPFYIDDGLGGGIDDWIDKDFDEDDLKTANKDVPEEKHEKEYEERIKKLEERETVQKQKEALSELSNELSKKYKGFDIAKVIEKLRSIEKEHPGRGDALFTPEGVEFIWKGEFMNMSEDEFDQSRGGGIYKEESDLINRLKDGSATLEDERKLFGRFI